MLSVGFVSGCLKVVSNDFSYNYQQILNNVTPLAEQEWAYFDTWNDFSDWSWGTNDDFSDYYHLDEVESKAFYGKQPMPESFVQKFLEKQLQRHGRYFVNHFPVVLWHKKNPCTDDDLVEALLKHELYEVECLTCGKHYFMDEHSICCVRWRSCSGAACLSTTVTDKICTYNNLCKANKRSTSLRVLNAQLKKIENMVTPLSFYGGNEQLKISYISDIHLLHHAAKEENGDIKPSEIRKIIILTVKQLYATIDSDVIVFAGDTSSSSAVTIAFYQAFVKYQDYLEYKNIKQELLEMQNQFLSMDKTMLQYQAKIDNLARYINKLKGDLAPFLNFRLVEQYRKRYCVQDSWADTSNKYKSVPSYIAKKDHAEYDGLLDLIAQKLDLLESFEDQYEIVKRDISETKATYDSSILNLTIKDIYIDHHYLSETTDVFVVLGNHEYIGFDNVQEAVSFYSGCLSPLGIKLLHNNFYELNNKFIIFGGTGFAKYNNKYNADTLVCCNNFTRQDEMIESDKFCLAYQDAKKIAHDKKLCLLCISHYPVRDCLNNIDPDTIYFYGHNHQNYYQKNEVGTIYADNQIGYENPHITFKTMSTGVSTNPYFALKDGLYETTIKDYLQFYDYLGEHIGEGALLYQRCKNDKATMYVIKRSGYYGFFLVNTNKWQSQSISIVNGGTTKRIMESVDLQWLFDNFEVVLSKYLQVLAPLRNAQEQLSKELQTLGLSGKIHGCIVDIDYYHHIMLNPVDGTMTYYYSPSFGEVRKLKSFDRVIASMKKHDTGPIALHGDYKGLSTKYKSLVANNTSLLSQIDKSYLLVSSQQEISELAIYEEMQTVSRSEGMYGLSRKISPLQRIFTGHVLRDFDVRLADTQH